MQKLSARSIKKLMIDFEKTAYENGYRISKASQPKPKDKFYESDATNHAFIGFCLAQK